MTSPRPVIIIVMLLCACHPKNVSEHHKEKENNTLLRYARGFRIAHNDSCTQITVLNDWQNGQPTSAHYYLCNSTALNNTLSVKVPAKKVICLSTSHIQMIEALHEHKSIIGVSNPMLVNSPETCRRIKNRLIQDVGSEANLDYETIISLQPDVVIGYGIEGENLGYITKLRQLGIPVIMNAEYLEPHPLGKAEWIIFFAMLFNKKDEATQIFDSIASRYNTLVKKVGQTKRKPGIITGLPFKSKWWVPGGKSYLAKMIEDAGGNYLWKDNPSSGSFTVSFEELLSRSSEADIWINCGDAHSMDEILNSDSRLNLLKAYKTAQVYNNNARVNSHGGNDFWESGILYPDRILADLIAIFHAEYLPGHTLYYYKKLQ